jgi:hypothetical protein
MKISPLILGRLACFSGLLRAGVALYDRQTAIMFTGENRRQSGGL